MHACFFAFLVAFSAAAMLAGCQSAAPGKFYDPAGYSEGEWRTWMARMSRKARLKPEQQELLSRYLNGFRAKRDAQE